MAIPTSAKLLVLVLVVGFGTTGVLAGASGGQSVADAERASATEPVTHAPIGAPTAPDEPSETTRTAPSVTGPRSVPT